MRTVVVTGAASFVGSNIIRSLLRDYDDLKIYGIVRPNSKSNEALKEFGNLISVLEIDMSNIAALKQSVSHIDIFYLNAWRGTRGEDRSDYPLQESNYKDTMQAVDTAIELGASTIIGVGSQAEYGVTTDEVTEEHDTNPNTAYGIYKLRVCNEATNKCNEKGVSFKWGRIFSAYGVGDYSKTLVMSCVDKMIKNEDININYGYQKWNYINIFDVATIFSKMSSESFPSGIYNISSNDTRFLKDYVLEMKDVINSKSSIRFGDYSDGAINLLPINAKVLRSLPDFRFVSFSDGIKEILKSRV